MAETIYSSNTSCIQLDLVILFCVRSEQNKLGVWLSLTSLINFLLTLTFVSSSMYSTGGLEKVYLMILFLYCQITLQWGSGHMGLEAIVYGNKTGVV